MSYYFNMRYDTPSPDVLFGRPCFRLVGTMLEAINVTPKVFLHRRTLVDAEAAETADEFVAICSPFDLSTYPADDPQENQDPPFFRKDNFDILLPNVTSATATIQSISDQLSLLTDLLSQLDVLSEVQEAWLPEAPPTTTPAP